MAEKFKNDIKTISTNIFETVCYMFPLEEWEIEEMLEMSDYEENTGAVVKFDGAANGMMFIKPCERLYEAIAANMLGSEETTEQEKEAALCEIANIVCGNTVPLFARNKKICLIRPPEIIKDMNKLSDFTSGMLCENVEIFFDEGKAQISVYYENGVN